MHWASPSPNLYDALFETRFLYEWVADGCGMPAWLNLEILIPVSRLTTLSTAAVRFRLVGTSSLLAMNHWLSSASSATRGAGTRACRVETPLDACA